MENYQDTIISQYASSPTLNQLIASFNGYIDPSANIDAFYANMWDVQTAQGYGLDVWGRIVGVTRILSVSQTVDLGFTGPSGSSGDSFNVAPFYQSGALTSNYALADPAFRTLIYAKALFNISNGSIEAINNILMTLFGASGSCWVIDNQNMTMIYNFNFAPTPVQLSIIYQSGVLPRPSGVAATVTHL